MIGIFLDDERDPEDVYWVAYPDVQWYTLTNAKDFMHCVSLVTSDDEFVVSFDHDIQSYLPNGDEQTGYDCLKYLIDLCMEKGYSIPKCFFHTQNPVGKVNMESYYNNAIKFIGE
tara:strand:+ start:75087 stop:75431 length:345 start_codon:yes stop_codon:yes gene_type:complete